MSPRNHPRLPAFLALLAAAFAVSCGAALGPGYTIDKQEIRVHFLAEPRPRIHIDAEYHLRNTGNQPLDVLELRLPGRRRFQFADPTVELDSESAVLVPSPANPRNVQVAFPRPWTVSSAHALHLSIEFQPLDPSSTNPAPAAGASAASLSFAPDAFFLPAEGWSPDLIPARGIFATGGVPPKRWTLTVQVPQGFLVHTSGRQSRASRSHGEQTIRAELRAKDGYAFVIAGRYQESRTNIGEKTIRLWTRAGKNSAALQQTADSLLKSVAAYNTMFGNHGDELHQLWVAECPVVSGCFTGSSSAYAKFISANAGNPSAQMASADSVIVDLTAGAQQIGASVGPSLASSWLGYGRNPGFFEQDPPLSALPAFAASQGSEAVQGEGSRAETIRRALRAIPAQPADPKKAEDDNVVRAKSFLFFYGLQDRYGPDVFDKSLTHMLYARRGGGFDLDDLISAFEQETHQNVAEFVRRWMKRPGVPEDFRARYANAANATTVPGAPDLSSVAMPTKETTP